MDDRMRSGPERPLILVIDDEPGIRHFITRGLESHGLAVHAAAERTSALDLAAKGRYALVLLDLQMPGLSLSQTIIGLQATQPGITILLMTGGAPNSLIAEGLGLGALGPLAKPFRLEELKDRIVGLLNGGDT
jgi:DNA-binding response OmpR family regulator